MTISDPEVARRLADLLNLDVTGETSKEVAEGPDLESDLTGAGET